jgi:hypothetical protein
MFHPQLIKLTHVKVTKEQLNTLSLGFNYAIAKDPKYYINELIIDTEDAIRHVDAKIQTLSDAWQPEKLSKSLARIHTTCCVKDIDII